MKTRALATLLSVSVILNLTAIPVLVWKLLGYRSMYRQSVDYASELAYAVGYHKALGHDLDEELEAYPTRLKLIKVRPDFVEALLWPAKRLTIQMDLRDPEICNTSIGEQNGSGNDMSARVSNQP